MEKRYIWHIVVFPSSQVPIMWTIEGGNAFSSLTIYYTVSKCGMKVEIVAILVTTGHRTLRNSFSGPVALNGQDMGFHMT